MTARHPNAPISDDLLGQDAVRESVRGRYREVIGRQTEVAAQLYSSEELALIPREAIEAALGVGDPIARAALAP
ncbi:MAG TPA: hypothetical protein VFV20_00655, partial [Candidatus Limnocylindria bacterium]|nr:hypothetical protein [Candidatus Limnocylindria bacterium]